MNPIKLRTQVSVPQARLINSTAIWPAMVAGFGAGKTAALCMRALRLSLKYPDNDMAYYLPTYDLVVRIGYVEFTKLFLKAGISFKLNQGSHIITFPGRRGKIIFRTLDCPERIVGYEVAHSFIDELDILKASDAAHCWRQIMARNRQKMRDGSPNTIAVGTTPEGFKFTYEMWDNGKPIRAGYELIHASTYSNERNLQPGYVDNLLATYPPQLVNAYINGEFTNLKVGGVYPDFRRKVDEFSPTCNHTDAVMQPGEVLHIGMDFNKLQMSATVNVIRENNRPFTVAEHTGVRDTPEMARLLHETYVKQGHTVLIYPDASGNQHRSTNASISDFSILGDWGLPIMVGASNPGVADRVMAMNCMIKNAKNERRWLVNTVLCPVLTKALEQQVYDKAGQPDKSGGLDHVVDAQGYFVNQRYPVQFMGMTRVKMLGT